MIVGCGGGGALRRLLIGALAGLLGGTTAQATVTLTASRTDALYTTDVEFDCGDLAGRMDADLPWNVVRIRAEDDGGQADAFLWKLPKPNVGFLMPDDPEVDSSAGGAFALQGFCAQVGSGCVFSKETLKAYRRPTILWAAPTCDGLPRNTRSQSTGDTVLIRVKAKAGKKGLGKAKLDVGYGRLGTPVLWVYSTALAPDNGIGKDLITTFLNPVFSVTLEPAIMPPVPIKDYVFDNGGGQQASVATCRFPAESAPGAPACALLEYGARGPFLPSVEVRLEDDSAYCDNAKARVAMCEPRAQLEVERSPRRGVYRSGDGESEEIVVTLHNRAPRSNGCDFILQDLDCTTEVRRRKFQESQSVTFEPARCAGNGAIFCADDLECGIDGPCLSESHCSETISQPCTADAQCSPRQCPACQSGETCTRVIQVPQRLLPGESFELLREEVDVRSVLPGKTKVTETWSVTERFGRGNDSTVERYRIRGEPVQ